MGQNAANIVWSLAKLGHVEDKSFFDQIAEAIASFLEYPVSNPSPLEEKNVKDEGKTGSKSYNNQELSNILWAYATIDRYHPRLFSTVCAKMKPLVPSFNGHDIASTLWSMAACGHVDIELLAPLLFRLKLQVYYLKTPEIGMIAFSLPKMEAALTSLSSPQPLTTRDVSKTLYSCQESSMLLIREMRDRMMASRDAEKVKSSGNNLTYLDFGSQEIAAAICMLQTIRGMDEEEPRQSSSRPTSRSPHSLSKAEVDEFHDWLLVAAMSCMDSFKPNDLANLLWSCAKSSSVPPGLMDKAISVLQPMLPCVVHCTSHLAKIFWSLGRMGFKIDSKSRALFLRALTSVSSPLLPSFGHQDLTNTLWAMSMFRLQPSVDEPEAEATPTSNSSPRAYVHGFFLRELVDCLKVKMNNPPRDCDQRELSSNAVSMGRLKELIYDYEMMELLAQGSVARIDTLGGQEMGNLCWGFAKAYHRNDLMMAAIGRKIIDSKGKGLRTQEAANIACAFSSLGLSGEWREVYSFLKPSSSSAFNTQDLANFSHAHAIAGLYEPWLLDLLLTHIGSQEDKEWESQSTKMSLEMTQVLAYLLILEEEGLLGQSRVTRDPRYLKLKELATRAYEANEATGSYVQREVFRAINSTTRILGGRFQGQCFLEMKTEDNLFSIDIAIPTERLAIEVDGPSHFLSSHPGEYEGTTLLRNRFLQNRGWTVASLPVARWRLKGSGQEPVTQDGYNAVSSLIEAAIEERDQRERRALVPPAPSEAARVEKKKRTRRTTPTGVKDDHVMVPLEKGSQKASLDKNRLSESHFQLALDWLGSSLEVELKGDGHAKTQRLKK